MKRDYLLAGSDWFGNFSLQSLLEMLSFLFALMPLIIASGQWYTGDPIAANFHGFRIALSTGAYLLLLLTWPLIKKLNRRTRRVLDQTIQTFKGGPKNNCKDLGTSNVMSSERTNMADTVESNKDKMFQQHFDTLFRQNRQMLYHVAYRTTGNHHDAEEALENGFLKVMEVFSKAKDPGRRAELTKNPIGYLRQAVCNAALDLLRRQKCGGRRHIRNTECEQLPAPESIRDLDERIPYLREALGKMKPKLVQILNLCLVDKKPCAEVAKKLRMPLGTVYANLWHAKHQVRRLIRAEEKRYEAQKNPHRGIPKPGLADASGA